MEDKLFIKKYNELRKNVKEKARIFKERRRLSKEKKLKNQNTEIDQKTLKNIINTYDCTEEKAREMLTNKTN